MLLPGTDPIKKVAIVPLGQALGVAEQVPKEDRHNLSCTYRASRVAVMMGGRVAEQLAFNDVQPEPARKCWSNNRESVDELTRMLIESETLSDEDIRVALNIDNRSKDECCAAISVQRPRSRRWLKQLRIPQPSYQDESRRPP